MEIRGSEGFELGSVEVAVTLCGRLRGLMGRHPVPLLLPTSMVHGFWLRAPLWVVGIDGRGVVIEGRTLNRRRLARLRGAALVLELPLRSPRPRLGERLAFQESDGEAELHAGTPLPLFHADRKPG